MLSKIAITEQTDAAVGNTITLAAGQSIQAFIGPTKLKYNEQVYVEQSPDNGTTWFMVSDPQYRGDFLDRQTTRNRLTGPGVFRLVKSKTTEAIAVYYDI